MRTKKIVRKWRGRNLRTLRKLQRALLEMSYQDFRNASNAEVAGAAPAVLFDDTLTGTITQQMQALSDRIDRALVEKW